MLFIVNTSTKQYVYINGIKLVKYVCMHACMYVFEKGKWFLSWTSPKDTTHCSRRLLLLQQYQSSNLAYHFNNSEFIYRIMPFTYVCTCIYVCILGMASMYSMCIYFAILNMYARLYESIHTYIHTYVSICGRMTVINESARNMSRPWWTASPADRWHF